MHSKMHIYTVQVGCHYTKMYLSMLSHRETKYSSILPKYYSYNVPEETQNMAFGQSHNNSKREWNKQ